LLGESLRRRGGLSDMMPPNARKARWDLLEIDLQGHRNGNGLWAAGRIPLELRPQRASGGLLTGVWLTAGFGVVLKLVLPGRFDRVAVVLYLLLGWSGVMVYGSVIASLPSLTLWLLAAGGVLYSMGVIFHLWRSLRFQNAIWHIFVLLAAGCHYIAVLGYAVLARA
jgi:predicted membrane channel-forming protein YqfA (hemolysin III family)